MSQMIEDIIFILDCRVFLDVLEIFEEDCFLLRSSWKFLPSGFLPSGFLPLSHLVSFFFARLTWINRNVGGKPF